MTIRPAAMLLFLVSLLASCNAIAQNTAKEQRPSVAVVLGGGGAHAIAHLGALSELERQNVPVDLIVGTGIGGVIGGLLAIPVAMALRTVLFRYVWVKRKLPEKAVQMEVL